MRSHLGHRRPIGQKGRICVWINDFIVPILLIIQLCFYLSIFLSSRNGSKSRIVTQRSEKVKGLDNNATLYAFVELRCNVTDDSHLFQLEPITLIYYVSQRALKITFILAKLTCLEEKFQSPTKIEHQNQRLHAH